MRFYIASRLRHKNNIEKILSILKTAGHKVVFDWTKVELSKPYEDNVKSCSQIAQQISDSLQNVEVFVLITDGSGTDMFIELGIVLNQWQKNSNIKIYVVGKYNTSSLMHFHPAIKRVDSFEEVLKEECGEVYDSHKEEISKIGEELNL